MSKNVYILDNPKQLQEELSSCRNALVGYAYSVLKNWDDAEDVVHDAFIKAFQKMDSFECNRNLVPWLRGFVRLQCLKKFEKEKRRKANSSLIEYFLLNNTSLFERWCAPEFADQTSLQIASLRYCLKKLPEKSREYLFKYYTSNSTSDEIALESDRSAQGLRVTICRLRQRLKNCIHTSMDKFFESNVEVEDIDKYFDGGLAGKEAEQFHHQLKSCRAFQDAFLEHLQFLFVLRCTLVRQKRNTVNAVYTPGGARTKFFSLKKLCYKLHYFGKTAA